MAYSFDNFNSVGATVCNLTYPFLLRAHIKVYKARDLLAGTGTLLSETTHYTWTGASQITLGTAIASGEVVTVERQTPNTAQLSPWTDGSNLTAEALNNADLQNLYVVQEQQDKNDLSAAKSISSETASNTATTNVSTLTASQVNKDGSVAMTGNLQLGTNKITGVGDPTAAQDAVTKAYLERTGSIQSAQIQDGTLVNNDVNASAAIAQSKLDIADATTSASGYMSAADKTKLEGCDTGSKDDQTASEIKSLIASSPLDASHIAANAVGDSEIATGALDNRYFTEAESDARYFNVSTGDTIKDGDAFPDNDTTIATTAAINDRIIDLVDDVGGFVPIASETNFPTANPDVNNGAGTLVSVKAIGSTRTPSSGTVSISNGSGSNTVTITGCGSTVLTAGFGVIVETTSTLHTYAFHRLVPKATEVTTVAGKVTEIERLGTAAAVEDLSILGTTDVVADLAILGTTDVVSDMNTLATTHVVADMNTLAVTSVINNMDTCATNVSNINNVGGAIANVNTVGTNLSSINDFADKYRIASSAPGSNNDDGDLYYNTSDNKLYVYNGSAWEVAASLNGSGGTVAGDTTFTDNTKLKLGSNDDLQIYHDGSNSYIHHGGTGNLNTRIGKDNGEYHILGNGNTDVTKFKDNGAVELYYDGSKKLNTGSDGIVISGNTTDTRLYFYTSGGTYKGRIETNNSSQIKVLTASGDDSIICNNDGAVELYHNNDLRLQTWSDGVNIYGDENESAILHLYADNGDDTNDKWRLQSLTDSSFNIQNFASGSWETSLYAVGEGKTVLYFNDSPKIETTNTGAKVTGKLNIGTDTAGHSDADDLTIVGGTDTGITLRSAWNGDCNIYFADGTTGGGQYRAALSYDHHVDEFYIKTNAGSTALTIDTSQKVTFSGEVDVAGGVLRIGAANTASGHINAWENMTFNIDTDNDDTNRTFKFLTNGSSGSGTTLLELNEVGGATFTGNVNTGPVLTVTGTDGVSANLYLIADRGDNNGDGWRINSNQDANDLTISNNTSGSYVDKFTLTNTGDATFEGSVTVKGTPAIRLGNSLELYNGFDNKQAKIQNAAGSNYSNLVFKVVHNGTEATALTIDPDTNLSPAANVIMAAGYGINFSARTPSGSSVDSNTLDDYEAGEFTPFYSTETTDTTFGYNGQYGYYVKIGKVVYYQVYIRMANSNFVSGGSGNMVIKGFPFASQDATTHPNVAYGGLNVSYTFNWSGTAVDRGLHSSGASKVYLYVGQSSGTNVTATNANLASGTQLRAYGSYIAA